MTEIKSTIGVGLSEIRANTSQYPPYQPFQTCFDQDQSKEKVENQGNSKRRRARQQLGPKKPTLVPSKESPVRARTVYGRPHYEPVNQTVDGEGQTEVGHVVNRKL